MKVRLRNQAILLLTAMLLTSSVTMAQTVKSQVDQQDAVELLKTLARDLKREPDKLAAGRLQARIAAELWAFDEPVAREVFRWAFEAVAQRVADDLPSEKRAGYVSRQASAMKDVLLRFGAHDRKQAAAWLKAFQSDGVTKDATAKADSVRSDLFMQIAAQMALTDPDEAAKLGFLALSGSHIPDGFGTLLFGLARNNRNLSDELFRAAIVTLSRNNYVYDRALLVLANYVFDSNGEMHAHARVGDAQLLANFYVDAAWKQAGGDGNPVTPSTASFYNQLEIRALPIVARYAPSRLPEFRGQLTRMASGLSAQQLQQTELLRAALQQESTVATRNNYTTDEQIERAEKHANPEVRDALFMSIAHRLMRDDPDRALSLAKKINNANMRTTTEDDIYLVKIQQLLLSRSTTDAPPIAEARKLLLQFSNPVFRAKILAQLAARVWSGHKDEVQATELLSEALAVAAKADDVPDKLLAQLQVVEQFAKFDLVRAFEVLGTALMTMNRLKADTSPPATPAKPPLLRIKNYTVINGVEMAITNDATLDSIDFREVRSLATRDYMQARLLASKLDQPLQRANYLTAVATSVLKPQN